MKYITLLLLGAVSVQAYQPESTTLTQLSSRNHEQTQESESDDDSSDEELVQTGDWFTDKEAKGDQGIIDATTPGKGSCDERLWISEDELGWQMDQFSRKFDRQFYDNAKHIAKELKTGLPKVHTWELLDDAWTFKRLRRYAFVQENMDMLEHFQDNLNTNISNEININNFCKVGKTVVANLKAKYSNGEFKDPALTDPRVEAAKDLEWWE